MKPVSTSQRPASVLDRDRVGVPAGVVVGLEEVDVVAGAEQLVGGDEPGDAGADHGDPQWASVAARVHPWISLSRHRPGFVDWQR